MIIEQNASSSPLALSPFRHVMGRYVEEAILQFAGGSSDVDQKRGLALHGPADKSDSGPQTIRIGIVSSASGIQQVTSWIQSFNDNPTESTGARPFVDQTFPGFVHAFDCKIITSADYNEELSIRI